MMLSPSGADQRQDLQRAIWGGCTALEAAPEFARFRDTESWVAMLSGPSDMDMHVLSEHEAFSAALAAALEATIDPSDLPTGYEAVGVAPVNGVGRDNRGLPTCRGLPVVGWAAPAKEADRG
jgi:hypothetical protein